MGACLPRAGGTAPLVSAEGLAGDDLVCGVEGHIVRAHDTFAFVRTSTLTDALVLPSALPGEWRGRTRELLGAPVLCDILPSGGYTTDGMVKGPKVRMCRILPSKWSPAPRAAPYNLWGVREQRAQMASS